MEKGMLISVCFTLILDWYDDFLLIAFSEHDQDYYTKLGWTVFPSQKLVFTIVGDGPSDSLSSAQPLTKDAIASLCNDDVASLTREVMRHTQSSIALVFEPSFEQMCWHFSRAEYLGQTLRQSVPDVFGAISPKKSCWMYWYQDLRGESLEIMRVSIPERSEDDQITSEVKSLLVAAIQEAKKWNVKKVICWNPTDITQAAANMLTAEHQNQLEISMLPCTETSIPSLRLKDGKNTKEVDWLHNEYYAWC
jgi:hypothetical protein